MTRLWTIGDERLLPEALVAELRAADGFRRHLDAAAGDELDALAAELHGGPPTALLCLEADPAHCHRRVVAEALARRRDDLEVMDL